MTGANSTMIEIVKKLYWHLNGCPFVYIIIYCSFLINGLCSTHPGLSIYFLYVYIYKVIRNYHLCSPERNKKHLIELEDIQLQVEIVKTKLSVFEAEINDRAKALQREVSQLRAVRARVAEMIATDDSMLHLLHAVNEYDGETVSGPATDRQDVDTLNNDLMMGLLGRTILKNDEVPDPNSMECGEHAENELTPKHSDYSSMNDTDMLQDCRVKIVKVTNVYKVAYLKNYIKQKRFRRANKRALLKKKMETIKELFEEWQKKLSMVINSKMTILNVDRQSVDLASQEAMGDYSKPFDISDSDSDMRNNDNMFFDEFRANRNELQEPCMSQDYYDFGEMIDHGPYMQQNEYFKPHDVLPITEETGSQLAIDEITSESADDECRDNVAI